MLAVVAGAVWWFYRETRIALLQAERLNFRRMIVPRIDEGDPTYRFFFVTNRRLESGDGNASLEDQFGRQREEALQFGSFDTAIDPSVSLGMFVNPTDWFTNEALQVNDVRSLERETLAEQIRQQVEASPGRSLLVLVHGYRTSFPSSLRMTAMVGHVLDIDTPVLVFDWPGDQGTGLGGYRRAQEVATASGAELAETLRFVVDEIRPDRLWLMANSMGAQVVSLAFTDLCEHTDFSDDGTEIEDVVLTAPDVARDEFGERFKDNIAAVADNLTVYVSSNDRALLASRLVNRERRLGESTLNPRNPNQFPEAASIAEFIEPESQRVTLVDVTPVNRTRNFHNFSLETPEFFDDVYLRLTNAATPRSRVIYPIRTPEGRVYWVLTRAW